MNPVLILTHNCLEMTKTAVESVFGQDIETELCVVDNGSSDGTPQWFASVPYYFMHRNDGNEGVSAGWNYGLNYLFQSADHVLVINNDVVLPPWFYTELLSYDAPFVTGVSVDKMEQIATRPIRQPLVGHPDFSAFLIHRNAWEHVGEFDESMRMYASDCDYHVRAYQKGMQLYAANVPFYHERSSTLRLSTPEERAKIESQAGKDREAFLRKWGFAVGSPEYCKVFEGAPEEINELHRVWREA